MEMKGGRVVLFAISLVLLFFLFTFMIYYVECIPWQSVTIFLGGALRRVAESGIFLEGFIFLLMRSRNFPSTG